MSKSTIEWTQSSWNPTTGCTIFSDECKNCYAKKLTERYMHNSRLPKYKAGFDVVVEHPETLLEPALWKEKGQTVFVNSMSDLFHKDVSLNFIKKVFKVMNDTPQHTYQVLTKRNKILEKYSKELTWTDNIWMGVSVGIKTSIRKIDSLVKCDAKHKFLSIEPLIEDLGDFSLEGIDLVLVGGESGDNKARPIKKEWVNNIKENCEKHEIPFFFKQWGKDINNPDPNDPTIDKNHPYHSKGGRLLDGKLYAENPSVASNDVNNKIVLFDKEFLIVENFKDLKIIWELKSYLPLMDDVLYKQLKDDIRKNGIIDPILYYKAKDENKLVIEGHTRLSAAMELKLKEIPTKEVKENFENLDDIKLWMVKHQFQRRNLSNIMKIKLAMLSKVTIEKLAKENLSKGGLKLKVENRIDTSEEIAKIAGVGRTSVVRYMSAIEKAPKVIQRQLELEEISINTAFSSIKRDKPPLIKSNKISKKSPTNYLNLSSLTEGESKLKTGEIDYFISVQKSKVELVSKFLKKKSGVYIV